MDTKAQDDSGEEYLRRGTEIYESRIRPLVENGNRGRIVAIDIDTGEYELGDDTLVACDRLLARLPAARIWLERIGYRGVHRYRFAA